MSKHGGERDATDWAAVAARSEDQVMADALDDLDAMPLTAETLASAPRMPQVKVIRRALRLTQEAFAARYQIPLGTLRDWEQGRSEPDQATRAYLKVIAIDPERVAAALATGAASA